MNLILFVPFLNVIFWFIFTAVNFKTNIFDGALWPLIQDRKKIFNLSMNHRFLGANVFTRSSYSFFLSDPFWKKGFQISMSRVFRTVCTFSPSKNSIFPKNEDFCFFEKQDFSKKRGLLRFRKKVLFQKIRTFTINRYTSESSF